MQRFCQTKIIVNRIKFNTDYCYNYQDLIVCKRLLIVSILIANNKKEKNTTAIYQFFFIRLIVIQKWFVFNFFLIAVNRQNNFKLILIIIIDAERLSWLIFYSCLFAFSRQWKSVCTNRKFCTFKIKPEWI